MLRLSRKAMASAGLQLISVTPHSRLNDFFPYVPVGRILRLIDADVGSSERESVSGLLCRQEPRLPKLRSFLQDIPSPKELNNNPELIVEAEGPIPV